MKRPVLAAFADLLICAAAAALVVIAIFTLFALVDAVEQVRIMPRFW